MRNIASKLLLSVGIVTIFYFIFLIYQTYSLTNRRVREVVEQQASMALKFNLAIRKYIAENVRPTMYELLGKEEFMPETMSTSYVSRTIFEDVRKEFPDYIIKFSSDNPRNPVNQAGPEELKVIEYLNNNPDLNRWEGIVLIDGKEYMAKFSARRMKEFCLRCHGDPKDAPTSLLKRYGNTAGFHRPIGMIIGSDTVAIPMKKISEQLWSESMPTFLASGLGLLLFFLAIIYTTKFIITNRLTMISQHFIDAAQQEDYSNINPIEIEGRDEISDLVFSFNTLTDKLKIYYTALEMQVKERTIELEDTNKQLREEISERECAEEAALAHAERFRVFFSSVNDAIFVHPFEEEGFAPFIEVNDIACERYGYSREEFLQLVAPEITEKLYANSHSKRSHRSELLEKGHLVFEAVHIKKTGETFPVEINSNIVYQFGKPFILAVVRDISERKQAEEERHILETQLQQSLKMEAIGTLAGGIAHDFNNVLYSIVGYTELTMEDVPEGSLAKDNLKEVLKGAMRAKDMVQQILTFSRKADTEKKPIKIQSVVKEALNLLRTSIPSTIELRQNIDGDFGPVMADPTQIHQVVVNLATNAYQAMREKGGVLELTLMEEEISLDDSGFYLDFHPGKYLKLTVSDTGRGMDNAVMEKIFDPYFTTKGPGEGTGMGLAMVHGIIKDHGGKIKVYSELGEGTVFHIYLPLIKTRPVEPKIITAGAVLTGTEHILFVDDEEPVVLMTQQILERLGYQVTSRTSSVEALEAFRAKPDGFDLVITDMTMPNMTGVELAPKLREIRSDIPIIICTGFSEVIDKDKAKDMGISAYVMKPILKNEIAGTIRKVLDEGREK